MGLRHRVSHRAFAEEAVGQARRVAQQIPIVIGRFNGSSIKRTLCRFIGELRHRPSHRQSRECISIRDRRGTSLPSSTSIIAATEVIGFRHRVEPENRVRASSAGRIATVADAKTLEIDRLAVLLDQQDRAGNLAGRDFVADVVRRADRARPRKSSAQPAPRTRRAHQAAQPASAGRKPAPPQGNAAAHKAVSSPSLHRSAASASAGHAGVPSASAPAAQRACPACGSITK